MPGQPTGPPNVLETHCRRKRSTNRLERPSKEIKRRAALVWIFPNQAAHPPVDMLTAE